MIKRELLCLRNLVCFNHTVGIESLSLQQIANLDQYLVNVIASVVTTTKITLNTYLLCTSNSG